MTDARIETILEYQWQYPRLIETGTGDAVTITEVAGGFRQCITIELNYGKYLYNVERYFQSHPNILFLQGDSPQVLASLCYRLREPTLFWLDAHWDFTMSSSQSDVWGPMPLFAELQHIVTNELPHTILIDDAHYFSGSFESYPTLDQIGQLASNFHLEVKDNIIRLTPKDN